MLGITGTSGVACSGSTAVPSASCSHAATGAAGSWCAYYDNSTDGAGTNWKLAAPLPYKWVRITLIRKHADVRGSHEYFCNTSVL